MSQAKTAQISNLQWERSIRLWRDGRLAEARKVLADLLSRAANLTYDEELTFRKDLGAMECEAGNLDEALQIMLGAALLAEHTTNYALRGRFHMELAVVYHKKGDYDQAFQEYTAATVYHERAQNWVSCGKVENNLGFLLIEAKKLEDAHHHLDRAERIFTKLGEYTLIAQVWDTRARAYLQQGAVDEAMYYALKAYEYLKTADEPALLIETLDTLSQVSFAKRIHDALVIADGCITEAAHILGIKHNTSLHHILENKLPQLLHLRKPKTHSRTHSRQKR